MEQNTTNAASQKQENVLPVFFTAPASSEKRIVCELCGYANPEFTAQCKKCSNYL